MPFNLKYNNSWHLPRAYYLLDAMNAQLLSQIWLYATLWTIARQGPLSMGFSRQEYWSGLPFPPPGNLPDPVIEPMSLTSPALAGRFLYHWATWLLYHLNHLNSFSQYPFHDSQFYRWGNQGAGRLISLRLYSHYVAQLGLKLSSSSLILCMILPFSFTTSTLKIIRRMFLHPNIKSSSWIMAIILIAHEPTTEL